MQGADVIFKNGDIVTVNPVQPRARAVAVAGGLIVAVGADQEMQRFTGPGTRVIDLGGKSMVPGFIDTHQHFMSRAIVLKTWIDCSYAPSIAELVKLVKERARQKPKGEWILGRGWSQDAVEEMRLPTRRDLDPVSPDHPVIMKDVSGHYAWCNTRALELAGIGEKTPARHGDGILRDASGKPTGVLRELAMAQVWKLAPCPTDAELLEACELQAQSAVEHGYTSIHNMMIPWPHGVSYDAAEIRPFVRLHQEGRLPLRCWLNFHAYKGRGHHLPTEETDTEMLDHLASLGLMSGFGDPMLKIGSIKIIPDGSVGAHSAATRTPYTDDPSTCGEMHYSQEGLNAVALKAHKHGFQLAIHAEADVATVMNVNAIEHAIKAIPGRDHRHRIEHANLMDDETLGRVVDLGIVIGGIPCVAGVSPWWRDMARRRFGKERERYLTRYKELFDRGAIVTGGTDGHPCGVWFSPILGLHERVTGFGFKVDEALKVMTWNSAYASFEEKVKGSIEVGKYADLTVLSDNPLTALEAKIKDITVEMTMVGGKIVYQRGPKA
jgi:hypothetical protein